MKLLASRTFWGILLIVGGIVFLLQNMGIIEQGEIFFALLLAVGGLAFISVYFQDRANWWALIPGIVLLAVATMLFLTVLNLGLPDELGGVIVLGGIGLAFLLVYLSNRENWWAIIPAGVMFTLTAVIALEDLAPGFEIGGFFFLGLGLTFAVVAILPTPQGQMRWALIPAGILTAIGLLIIAALSNLINFIWPVVLILVGLFLVMRTLVWRS
jgi:hypothetical protein